MLVGMNPSLAVACTLLCTVGCKDPVSADDSGRAGPRETSEPTDSPWDSTLLDDSEPHGETGDTQAPDPFPLLPATPLHTEGRWILDANGERFKLASVNWYGFEELDYTPAGLEIADLDAIARRIRELGFNSVRLPF